MSIVVKLTADEEALLQKHGDVCRALDSGARQPTCDAPHTRASVPVLSTPDRLSD